MKKLPSFLSFLQGLLRGRCFCGDRATAYPHGIPTCPKHYHYSDCSSWFDKKCDASCGGKVW